MSNQDDFDFEDFKPYLAARGLSADRLAEIEDPHEAHRVLSDLIATFPERRADEDSQDWWGRVVQARAAARQAERFGPGVISLANWKARHSHVTLVQRTYGFLSYGEPTSAGDATGGPALPDRAILTTNQLLEIFYSEVDGTIQVEIETIGLFALEQHSSDRSFLVSFGTQDQGPILPEQGAVCFSDEGMASLHLPDTPEVRVRLGHVTVDEIR